MKIPPAIESVKNEVLSNQIQMKLDNLTKPVGSLGRLEGLAHQFCLCRKRADAMIQKAAIFTFAGDHGVTDEGVAPFPKSVTAQMVLNMVHGGAAVSVMSRNAGIMDYVVDMGVDFDFPDHHKLIKRKYSKGTKSFLKGPAMTPEECLKALADGFDLGYEANYDLLGVGEMGIGNTSSASALFSLLLNLEPDSTVGLGTGAPPELLKQKTKVIRESVEMHRIGWDKTPFDALCRVGGFEIAGIVGFLMGAAASSKPIVVDGFIASAAAAVATQMTPNLKDYLFFSHRSAERFHAGYLEVIGMVPILDLGMRLGEGTGSVLAMQIIIQAMNCYHQMATFKSAGIAEKDNRKVLD